MFQQHGLVTPAWKNVADVCNTLDEFSSQGGVTKEGIQKKCLAMLADHREKVKNGEWESGQRSGEDPEVHQILNDLMCEENDRQEEKDSVEAGNAARVSQQAARADKVSHCLCPPKVVMCILNQYTAGLVLSFFGPTATSNFYRVL